MRKTRKIGLYLQQNHVTEGALDVVPAAEVEVEVAGELVAAVTGAGNVEIEDEEGLATEETELREFYRSTECL